MAQRKRNPLDLLPTPAAIRRRLEATERDAERLRILLQAAEKLETIPSEANEAKGESRELANV
jgi:hypothetical protein